MNDEETTFVADQLREGAGWCVTYPLSRSRERAGVRVIHPCNLL